MRPTKITLALALAGTAFALGACAPDRVVTGSTYPYDYRERHPIVLAKGEEVLEIFGAGAGLDARQEEDLRAFASTHRRFGQGPIVAELPAGPAAGADARRALPVVKAVLAEAGVPPRAILVRSYVPGEPGLAKPIRLSFARLKGEVASRCGTWPQDLGVSNVKSSANNEPYWNLGCAMQTNVAAQVSDPVDLVRPRSEGRVDTIRRSKNIEKLRDGQDPSTRYQVQPASIGQVGGN